MEKHERDKQLHRIEKRMGEGRKRAQNSKNLLTATDILAIQNIKNMLHIRRVWEWERDKTH